jgi:hypothetical protein
MTVLDSTPERPTHAPRRTAQKRSPLTRRMTQFDQRIPRRQRHRSIALALARGPFSSLADAVVAKPRK